MSNPTLLRMLRQTLYSLKRQYGGAMTYHSLIDTSVDRKTGKKTTISDPIEIRYGIVLPIEVSQSIIKNIGLTSEDKTLPKGGGFLQSESVFMIDGKDLRVSPKQGDWIVYDHKQFDITKTHDYCASAAFILEVSLVG